MNDKTEILSLKESRVVSEQMGQGYESSGFLDPLTSARPQSYTLIFLLWNWNDGMQWIELRFWTIGGCHTHSDASIHVCSCVLYHDHHLIVHPIHFRIPLNLNTLKVCKKEKRVNWMMLELVDAGSPGEGFITVYCSSFFIRLRLSSQIVYPNSVPHLQINLCIVVTCCLCNLYKYISQSKMGQAGSI
jgi:hypothetical protein